MFMAGSSCLNQARLSRYLLLAIRTMLQPFVTFREPIQDTPKDPKTRQRMLPVGIPTEPVLHHPPNYL